MKPFVLASLADNCGSWSNNSGGSRCLKMEAKRSQCLMIPKRFDQKIQCEHQQFVVRINELRHLFLLLVVENTAFTRPSFHTNTKQIINTRSFGREKKIKDIVQNLQTSLS